MQIDPSISGISLTVIQSALVPASVATVTVAEQTFTLQNVAAGDRGFLIPPNVAPTAGVAPTQWRCTTAGSLIAAFVNPTAGGVVPITGATNQYSIVKFSGLTI